MAIFIDCGIEFEKSMFVFKRFICVERRNHDTELIEYWMKNDFFFGWKWILLMFFFSCTIFITICDL